MHIINEQIASFHTSMLREFSNYQPWELTCDSIGIVGRLLSKLTGGYIVNNNIAVHNNAVIENGVIIKGPAIIGPGCFIATGAYIRGGCWLEANCILGHEGVGIVDKIGAGVTELQSGDHVLVSCISADGNRLEIAKRLGATATINSADGKGTEKLMQMTNGRGVDTAIEAVGIPATFIMCEDIVAPGGTIANIGVHGTKADLHLERLWSQNISITTRLVDTVTTPMLFKTVESKKINPKLLISHHFKFSDILEAYETFGQAAKTKALKVIIDFK